MKGKVSDRSAERQHYAEVLARYKARWHRWRNGRLRATPCALKCRTNSTRTTGRLHGYDETHMDILDSVETSRVVNRLLDEVSR